MGIYETGPGDVAAGLGAGTDYPDVRPALPTPRGGLHAFFSFAVVIAVVNAATVNEKTGGIQDS